MYQHRFLHQPQSRLPLGKILCVGQNYADHIAEMNSKTSAEPLLFIKPASAACAMEQPLVLPTGRGACHFETEMSLLIGRQLCRATEAEAADAIAGVGLAFDLTLRDLQAQLKSLGHPWEKAKGFDGAAPLSAFVPVPADYQSLDIRLWRNGELTQNGNTAQMIHKVLPLLVYASHIFTLEPGDVLLTGTPSGVGPLVSGDQLVAELGDLIRVETSVG